MGEKEIRFLIDNKKDHPLVRMLSRCKFTEKDIKEIVSDVYKIDDYMYKKRLLELWESRSLYPEILLTNFDQILGQLLKDKDPILNTIKPLVLGDEFFTTLTKLKIYDRFYGKYDAVLFK